GGKTYSVTEYTMSEIIASVYEKIEQTGFKEGILFIDEINCVSETLAPTMLQFLQCKTFGNQKVPEGWIIVAAGNPPEYNRSVREFDVVTLDRIKKIDVEADFGVWKEYAYQTGIHQAIISYLELKKENFYRVETTIDGKLFATARGWEDLSNMIMVYEELGIPMDREVVEQYIQHWKIAKDFANYLELYYKYRKDYKVEEILQGHITEEACDKIRRAAFDEKLSVIGLLIARLHECFFHSAQTDAFVTELYGKLKLVKERMETEAVLSVLEELCVQYERETEQLKKAQQLDKETQHLRIRLLQKLEQYRDEIKTDHLDGDEAFSHIREQFGQETKKREQMLDKTDQSLNFAFDFMEKTFGDSQEMVIFLTELNTDYYAVWYVDQNGCDRYYKYNRSLLFSERQKGIMQELTEIEEMI
ncbi:MAG: ATPase, partial [Lachnospiraceae bacterium]|nr:ATPase [Lachnospiraceae bacterium]